MSTMPFNESKHRAKLIRQEALKGSTPLELSKRFGISRSMVYQILRNHKVKDPSYKRPARLKDMRDVLWTSRIKLATALGFSGLVMEPIFEMGVSTIWKLRKSKWEYNPNVSLKISISPDPKHLDSLFGVYTVSALNDSFQEVILVDGVGDADVVELQTLYGRVTLVGVVQ